MEAAVAWTRVRCAVCLFACLYINAPFFLSDFRFLFSEILCTRKNILASAFIGMIFTFLRGPLRKCPAISYRSSVFRRVEVSVGMEAVKLEVMGVVVRGMRWLGSPEGRGIDVGRVM